MKDKLFVLIYNISLNSPLSFEESKSFLDNIGTLGGDLAKVVKIYQQSKYEGLLSYKQELENNKHYRRR